LTASNWLPWDFFGNSVSISGDFAIVGIGNIVGWNEEKAYVFARSGSDWSEQGILTPSDGGTAFSSFGSSVSISGDYAIVGAFNHEVGGNVQQGKVYLFER